MTEETMNTNKQKITLADLICNGISFTVNATLIRLKGFRFDIIVQTLQSVKADSKMTIMLMVIMMWIVMMIPYPLIDHGNCGVVAMIVIVVVVTILTIMIVMITVPPSFLDFVSESL